MRVVIDYDIKIFQIDMEESNFLKKCCVWTKTINDENFIIAQKIDLYEQDMEKVLDIISFACEKNISLKRYDTGRYKLNVD